MEKVLEVINEDFENGSSVPHQEEGNDADDNDVIEPSVDNKVEWLGGSVFHHPPMVNLKGSRRQPQIVPLIDSRPNFILQRHE